MSATFLLVDDHPVVRDGLRAIINRQPAMKVVGEAEDGKSAITMAKNLGPDFVIMDIAMPNLDGIDATRQIRKELPHTKVLALSFHSERSFVYEMFRAGASGYVLKNSCSEELLQAIRTIQGGQMYMSPAVASNVVADFIQQPSENVSPVRNMLTAREVEVVQMLVTGKSTKEIGASMHLSSKTIDTHRGNILKKLKLRSMVDLTKWAIRENLTTLS